MVYNFAFSASLCIVRPFEIYFHAEQKKTHVTSAEGLLVFTIDIYLNIGFLIISWMNGSVSLIGLIKSKKDLDYLI